MKTIKELEAETYTPQELIRRFTLKEIRLFRVETLKDVLKLINELSKTFSANLNKERLIGFDILERELKARITGEQGR